jgi:hypothetical protein
MHAALQVNLMHFILKLQFAVCKFNGNALQSPAKLILYMHAALQNDAELAHL